MKAIVFEKYGLPEEVLELREIDKPEPRPDEVLVRIHAAAINDYDWSMVRGKPLLYRLMFGISKPKQKIPGMELSGIVEQTGENVKKFKVGDAVFGDISSYGFGCFAEYLSINENALIKKPEFLSFAEAAAIPHASLLALQALRDIANIQKGRRLLINGGGGGVGIFGLQLAKLFDCEVAGTDTGEKLNMMKDLGYDRVIDYKQEEFTHMGLQYDIILDCKSNKSPFSLLKVLKPEGTYVTVGGSIFSLISILFWGKILSLFSAKKLRILALKPNAGLEYITELFNQGKLRCVLDGPFAMDEIPNRLQYFGEGKHQGKIVVRNIKP